MGRTQRTYRTRLQEIRDRMLKLVKNNKFEQKYKKLWVSAHNLSAPASTFPWPETHAVATFCMLLEALKQLHEIEELINENKSN